jgi:hypothetical protein
MKNSKRLRTEGKSENAEKLTCMRHEANGQRTEN